MANGPPVAFERATTPSAAPSKMAFMLTPFRASICTASAACVAVTRRRGSIAKSITMALRGSAASLVMFMMAATSAICCSNPMAACVPDTMTPPTATAVAVAAAATTDKAATPATSKAEKVVAVPTTAPLRTSIRPSTVPKPACVSSTTPTDSSRSLLIGLNGNQ